MFLEWMAHDQFRLIACEHFIQVEHSASDDRPRCKLADQCLLGFGARPIFSNLFGLLGVALVIRLAAGEEGVEHLLLFGVCRPRNRFAKGEVQPIGVVAPPSLTIRAANARAASVNVGSLSRHERRQRRIRSRPLHRAFLSRRRVECLQHRMQILTLPMHIDAASPLLLVGVTLVFANREVEMFVVAGRLIRSHTIAADRGNQEAADQQRRIANRFGRIAKLPLPRHEFVQRIALQHSGGATDDCRYARLMTISFSMCLMSQPLSTNSTASESSNAAFSGGSPCPPKSSSDGCNSAAEAEIPKSVGHDAGRLTADALLGVGEPIREIEPRCPAARLELAEKFGDRRLDDFTAVVQPIAARQDSNLARLNRHGDHGSTRVLLIFSMSASTSASLSLLSF